MSRHFCAYLIAVLRCIGSAKNPKCPLDNWVSTHRPGNEWLSSGNGERCQTQIPSTVTSRALSKFQSNVLFFVCFLSYTSR